MHRFVNDLERAAGTYLYGRRMYETMIGWETEPSFAAESALMQDFAAIWQAADKIVYSRTLEAVSTARTRIERDFDPEAIRQLKATTGRDISIGGPDLASHAIKAGLVDECHLFLAPIIVGGGTQSIPTMSAWSLNCWRNAVLVMAWFISATEPGRDENPQALEIGLPVGSTCRPTRVCTSRASLRCAAGGGSWPLVSRGSMQVDNARRLDAQGHRSLALWEPFFFMKGNTCTN